MSKEGGSAHIGSIASNLDAKKKVREACEAVWEANKTNCSGFVKAVASRVGVVLDGDADAIMTSIRGSASWSSLDDGAAAAGAAADGKLVIAGLSGKQHQPARNNGHVVVVVAGPLDREKYPTAYWGTLGGVGKKETTLNYAWNEKDRDKITYYEFLEP